MSVTGSIIAGVGLAGGIGSAAIGANAAGNAASTQAGAANYAANLQAQEANQSANLQAGAYNNSQQLAAPFVQSGESGLANLDNLLGVMPQVLTARPNTSQVR